MPQTPSAFLKFSIKLSGVRADISTLECQGKKKTTTTTTTLTTNKQGKRTK